MLARELEARDERGQSREEWKISPIGVNEDCEKHEWKGG